jgi:adenylate cyclase
MTIREAIGSSVPQPSDPVREIELDIVPLLEAQRDLDYPLDVMERLLRNMADGLQRYVLAENDAFRDNVVLPAVERTQTGGREVAQAVAAGQQRLGNAGDRAMLAVYHALEAHAVTAGVLEGFERSLEGAGLYARQERPPAMCFLDITGYTRLTAEQGDDAAVDLADKLGRLVHRTALEHRGRPVKWLGDGVMLWFADPGSGVTAALTMAEGVVAAGLPPAHVGLHAGPVIVRDGDYYGQTVNIASRIAAYARPGEILVSQVVVDGTEDGAFAFNSVGEVDLKGVGGPLALYVANRVAAPI